MSNKRRQSAGEDGGATGANAVKRRRQYTEEDSKLASLFNDLASEVKDDRMNAAKELITKVAPENEPNAELVNKVLLRLIKGLCSGRKAARLGFSMVLTEVLRSLFGPKSKSIPELALTVDGVIDMVTERTKPEGRVAGQVSIFLHVQPDLQMIESVIIGEARSFAWQSIWLQSHYPIIYSYATECFYGMLDQSSRSCFRISTQDALVA